MAYTDFSLPLAMAHFGFRTQTQAIFTPEERPPVGAIPFLEQTLLENMDISLASEKAKSEFIVAPILMTVRRLSGNTVAIYSGQRFDVTPADGLVGECDFILSSTPPAAAPPTIDAPIISVVEAKRGDLEQGWGQCAAQMVAALRFNQNSQPNRNVVYGCVTTGYAWQFMRLQNNILTFDNPILQLLQKELILATFLAMLK